MFNRIAKLINDITRKYNIKLESELKSRLIIKTMWCLVEYTNKYLISYIREKHNDLIYITNRWYIR
jgi:hypothetical protein